MILEQTRRTEPENEAALQEALLHLGRLLQERDIEGARAFVRQLAIRWPDSDRVRHYARVLAPPEARVSPGEPSRSWHEERAWLRAHGHEHAGCWLAIHEDRLIAADPELRKVLEAISRATDVAEPLLFYQSEISDWLLFSPARTSTSPSPPGPSSGTSPSA